MYLDLTPKGRNETGRGNLTDWVRHHDRYHAGGSVDRQGRYVAPQSAKPACCAEPGLVGASGKMARTPCKGSRVKNTMEGGPGSRKKPLRWALRRASIRAKAGQRAGLRVW